MISALWTINASFQLGDGALMDGLWDGKTVLLVYLYCIFWWLAMELCKTLLYVIWEKIQFHEDAHFSQFFNITGYGFNKNAQIATMPKTSSDAIELKEMKENNDLK